MDIVRGPRSVCTLRTKAERQREREGGREKSWKQVGEEEAGVEEEGRARKGCGH